MTKTGWCGERVRLPLKITHVQQLKITTVLKSLHWLPPSKKASPSRFSFLLFHLLYGISPGYIHDIITKYQPARSLRSALSQQVTVSRTHHSWGHRSFSNAAPELWNNLPFQLLHQQSLSSFKSSLKTHIFCFSV